MTAGKASTNISEKTASDSGFYYNIYYIYISKYGFINILSCTLRIVYD